MSDPLLNLALRLFDIGAVKFGAFKLKLHETQPDAPLSPYFFNLRTPENPKPGPLGKKEVEIIARHFAMLAQAIKLRFDHVAGVPNAGDPLAAATCEALGDLLVPCGLLKLVKREGAEGRRVAEIDHLAGTRFAPGERVLLIDDLITKADSKLEAIKVLEEAGLVVKDVVVIIDREQGGREALQAKKYKVHELFRVQTLLNFYVMEGRIPAQTRDEARAYLESER